MLLRSDQCLSASIIRPYKEFRLWWHRELWWLITWKGLDFQVKSLSVVIESAEVSAGQKEPENINHLWSLSGLQWKEKLWWFDMSIRPVTPGAAKWPCSPQPAARRGRRGELKCGVMWGSTPQHLHPPLNLPWGSALSILSLL